MRYLLFISFILVLFYSCNLETKRLEHYTVHGIDVSHYQAQIDWDKVVAQNVSFSFVKATEGEEFKDSLFNYNWAALKEKGIKRGAYHFFHPTLSTHKQARNFVSTVHLEAGDLPPVLDIEVTKGSSPEVVINRARTWLEIIEQHYQIRPIIYTNLDIYTEYIADNFSSYPIWIARYNYRKPRLSNGQQWSFWQYGNRGSLEGIDGDVDFNVFHGSYEELNELCVEENTALSDLVSYSFHTTYPL